jgi:hypothetical protein
MPKKFVEIIIRNVPYALRKALKGIANDNDESMNSLIVRILNTYAEDTAKNYDPPENKRG